MSKSAATQMMMNSQMTKIDKIWAPKSLDEAHFATAVLIGFKDGFGRYLPLTESRALVGDALRRSKNASMKIALYEAIMKHAGANAINDRGKIQRAVATIEEMLEHHLKNEKTSPSSTN